MNFNWVPIPYFTTAISTMGNTANNSSIKCIVENLMGKASLIILSQKRINKLTDVELAETNELGRVNRVDPLGITYFRIRGMWGIENPVKVFNDISSTDTKNFSMNAIMLNSKYLAFPENDRVALETLRSDKFTIKDIKIKSPNNPAIFLDAKLLTYK